MTVSGQSVRPIDPQRRAAYPHHLFAPPLLARLPPAEREARQRSVAFERAGWRLLLAAEPQQRLICVDTSLGGASLGIAELCESLDVMHADREELNWLERRLEGHSCQHANFTYLDHDGRWPQQDGSVDGVIVPDLGRALAAGSRERPGQIASFVAEMARVVQPDGFAYLALRNRFSLSRSRATPPATVTGLRRVAVITALRRHGFRTLRVYPLVLDQELVTDVLINGGYRSVRNSFRFTERSKELLLRPPLASFLAPAVAIVAHRRPAEPSGLQQLLVETAPHLGELPNATRPLSVERYQISHGKAVVTLRVPGGGRQRFVALMPLREDSSRRQREEIAILRQLHAKQLQVSRCVPKPLSEGRVQTRPFHLQTAIDGIAIDLPFTQMASITRQAAEALTQFHRETRREAVLDGEQLTRLVRDPIRRVVEKLGSESDEPSRRIAERIETAWHGRRVPLVWCHGDYKLENVLFRRHDLKLCGIIDWDLSQPRSLPLLDLVYLVGYNHRIRTGMRIEEFTRNLLLTERLEPFDRELIDAYIAALGLDSATVALLRGLFWIYHLAFRIQLMPGLPRFREELMATLHVTREYYESRGIS